MVILVVCWQPRTATTSLRGRSWSPSRARAGHDSGPPNISILRGCGLVLRGSLWGRRCAEEPGSDVVGDRLQACLADALAVNGRHVVAGVAHEMIERDLIFRLAPDGLDAVA